MTYRTAYSWEHKQGFFEGALHCALAKRDSHRPGVQSLPDTVAWATGVGRGTCRTNDVAASWAPQCP
eukprot:4943447-Amphidinium_carterae.2